MSNNPQTVTVDVTYPARTRFMLVHHADGFRIEQYRDTKLMRTIKVETTEIGELLLEVLTTAYRQGLVDGTDCVGENAKMIRNLALTGR